MGTSKGFALWEALPITALLAAILASLFFVAYLFCARTYVAYQAEQALYCLAEGKTRPHCQRAFKHRLSERLPWGELKRVELSATGTEFLIGVQWTLGRIQINFQRMLTPEQIAKKALSWSAWPH